ncbi:MAG: CAP domain-containing protein [Campylobacterales bacterium]|nr:CAP domain-containing protein [Campylobacterales bacterium]
MIRKLSFLIIFGSFLYSSNPVVLINDIRLNSGLNALIENPILNHSSINHSNYVNFNKIVGHNQRKGRPYFTGEKPADRAIYKGYKSRSVLENVSNGQENFSLSIDGLMSAIYHRFGFLSFNINEIGYGRSNKSYVYNMGNSHLNDLCNSNFGKPKEGHYVYNICKNKQLKIKSEIFGKAENKLIDENPDYVFHPFNNQTNVPPVFYEEDPDPLPRHKVSGYPLSIEFNKNRFDMANFKAKSFELLDESLTPLDLISHKGETTMSEKNDPNKKFSKHQFAIFPKKRLDYGKTYHGRFSYTYNGTFQTIQWSFQTKDLEDLITYQEKPIPIVLGNSYNIYIPPSTPWEVITRVNSNCSYFNSGNVDIITKLYDNNTVKVQIFGEKVKECTIKLNNKKTIKLIIQQ